MARSTLSVERKVTASVCPPVDVGAAGTGADVADEAVVATSGIDCRRVLVAALPVETGAEWTVSVGGLSDRAR